MSHTALAHPGHTPKKVCTFSMGVKERDMIRWLLERRGHLLIRWATASRKAGHIKKAMLHEAELEYVYSSLKCMGASEMADDLHTKQMDAQHA